MANTSSAIKMVRKIAHRTTVNRVRKSKMRTAIRKVEEYIAKKDQDNAKLAFVSASSEIQKNANNNIIHKNAAARKMSRLSKRIKNINA